MKFLRFINTCQSMDSLINMVGSVMHELTTQLECSAAFTGRNGGCFTLYEMRAPATNIKTLKTTDGILLHCVCQSLYIA